VDEENRVASRAKRGTGSVRKLPSGKYQVRITGPDLARHTAPITFATKAAAEAWIVAEARRMDQPDDWIPPRARLAIANAQRARAAAERVHFGEFAEQVVATRTVKGRPLAASTRLRYEQLLAKYINPTFGELAVEEVTAAIVTKWWVQLPDSPKLRREAYTLARSVMRDATALGGPIPGGLNPFQIRGAGSGTSPKRETTVSQSELEVIRATIREEWRPMVSLALWCGMRLGELIELRRSDIDLAKRQIHIRRSLALAGGADRHVKGTKSDAGARDQRIPDSVVPELAVHLKAHMTGRHGLVFPSRNGIHLNPSVFYGKPKSAPKAKQPPKPVPGGWFAARDAAGRPELRFHDLRATGATLLAQNGATVAEVQEFLGDSTPTAALRYVRSTSARMDALTGRLSELASGDSW
jgi:integrase